MPRIENGTYLRVQASHDPWSVGLKRTFGTELNEMTRNWRRSAQSLELKAGGRKYANELSAELYNWLIAQRDSGQTSVRIQKLLSPLLLQQKPLDDALTAVREMVFEEVRHKYYRELPSRQKCLYLSPDRPECVRYWWDQLATQGADPGRKIFEVRAAGDVFLVPASILTLQSICVDEWTDLAHKYWLPHPEGSPTDEILFEGAIEVVTVRDRAEFGISGP